MICAFKEQSPHLPLADHSCDLSESEEGDEQDETYETHCQKAMRIPAKHRWKAIGDGISMPHTHHDALHDVKGDEHHGEDEAFVKDRVDERFVAEPRAKAKIFGSEQDLCENECVYEGKGVLLV